MAASSLVLGITVLIRTYLLDGLISLSFSIFDDVCVCENNAGYDDETKS